MTCGRSVASLERRWCGTVRSRGTARNPLFPVCFSIARLGMDLAKDGVSEGDCRRSGTIMSTAGTLLGMCCGVGFVAVSAFLGVVMVFLFVALVGTVTDALDWYRSLGVRPSLAAGRCS